MNQEKLIENIKFCEPFICNEPYGEYMAMILFKENIWKEIGGRK